MRSLVVVGPGAIGCLLAGKLAGPERSVWLLDHHKERAALIAEQGLIIESATGTEHHAVNVTADANEPGSADLLLLCVKSYDTLDAMQSVSPLLGSGVAALSLQNGLGNIEKMAKFLPINRIMAGTTTLGATLLAPGHIHHAGDGMTVIGAATSQGRPRAAAIVNLLRGSGLGVGLTENLLGLLWSKLAIIAAIGPVSAISGKTNGELLEDSELRAMLSEAAIETAAVAHAKGIKLLYQDAVAATEEVCKSTAKNASSMLQDVRAGRRTEIDAINGIILREARALCMPAPVNSRLYEAVTRLQGTS